jgi:hypothetical protein
MPPPLLVALTQLGATSMPLMRRRQTMNAAPTPVATGTAALVRLFCNTARQLVRT